MVLQSRTRALILIPLIALAVSGCSFSTRSVTDAGIFFSDNSGEAWIQKVFVSQQKKKTITIGSQNVYFFVFHPSDENIVYASMETGLFKTVNRGEQWEKMNLSGFVNSFIIDPKTTEIQYAAIGRSILKTTDNGVTWSQVYIDRPGVAVTALAMHESATNKIFAGNTDGSLLVSEDFGNTWTAQKRLSESIQRLIISDPSPSTMYALMLSKGFAKSNDGGATWDEVALISALKTYPTALPFRSFYLRPETTGDMIIASAFGILRSTNGGETWTPVPTVIPYNTTPANAALMHPDDPKKIFFTASNIFYATDDGGETWKTLQTIATSHEASKLFLNPLNPSQLYIGITKIQKK